MQFRQVDCEHAVVRTVFRQSRDCSNVVFLHRMRLLELEKSSNTNELYTQSLPRPQKVFTALPTERKKAYKSWALSPSQSRRGRSKPLFSLGRKRGERVSTSQDGETATNCVRILR